MNRLKKLRKENNLSQRELGKAIGVTGQAISLYERGDRQLKLKTLGKLADYFGVSADYLRGADNNIGSEVGQLEKENKDLREQLAVYKRELGMIVMSVPNVDEMILDFEEENHIKNGYGTIWEDEDED